MPQYLLLDGFNLAFRSFYAVPELNRSDGFPTNALHGWIKTLWRLEDLAPEGTCVAFFDLGGDVRREALLEAYKANRSEMPESLRLQIDPIKKLTALMGIQVVESRGTEADDLIAGMAEQFSASRTPAAIISADKDLAQCVTESVQQWLPPPTANPRLGWRQLDPEGVREKFGVRPNQIPDYLALIGDTSDNIPGLAGVGPKTAAKWLQQYGSLQAIVENCGRLNPRRFQQMVSDERDRLFLNLDLTRLQAADPPTVEARSPDLGGLEKFLSEMEMESTRSALSKRHRYKEWSK